MFEVAIVEGVDYIHLLQGADLPLKTPEQIDCYINKHQGKNFFRFIAEGDKFIKYKYYCKHFFVDNTFYRIIRRDPCRLKDILSVKKRARECRGVDISCSVAAFGYFVMLVITDFAVLINDNARFLRSVANARQDDAL